jgi:hypothetical protein
MAKVLVFTEGAFGQYKVSLEPDTLGHVIRHGDNQFGLPHPSWVIVGFGRDFRSTRIDIPMSEVAKDPKKAEGRVIYDRDHGTLRLHSGGGDHKARNVYVEEA